MKTNYLLLILLCTCYIGFSQNIFINEIKYLGETGVEIKAPENTNLQDFSLVFYKGTSKKMYKTFELSGIIDASELSWFPIPGISDGHPKGAAVALIYNNSNIIEFLSYGDTSFIAKDGIAAGSTTTNIGSVDDTSNTSLSIQRTSTGSFNSSQSTPAKDNITTETLSLKDSEIEGFAMYPNPVTNGELNFTSRNNSEKHIEIYSMVGKLVFQQEINSNQPIAISHLNKGFYMVRVSEEGKIATQKLVVN